VITYVALFCLGAYFLWRARLRAIAYAVGAAERAFPALNIPDSSVAPQREPYREFPVRGFRPEEP
jgi:hypothetical protein